MTQAFPLQWPHGRPRRSAARRKDAQFGTARADRDGYRYKEALTVAAALDRLQGEIDALGARYPVVSSNVETRLDGRPRSGQSEPSDPGVAVYFQIAGKPHCLPCDTYTTVAGNIAAVAAHIHATRAIERHGVASVVEMFSGFAAIEPPGASPWWRILQVSETAALPEIEASFRKLAAERHPDRGGSDAMMAELNAARDAARKARS